MRENRLGFAHVAAIVSLSVLTLGIGLGRAGRLTYHEAITAQSARELLTNGDVLVPTLDARPWLEKPPLIIWLVALGGYFAGGVDATIARLPATVGAALLALGVASIAARRFGKDVGMLAGLVQVTTVWTVMRGRLAEGDILLACLLTWTLEAFDRLRWKINNLTTTPQEPLGLTASARIRSCADLSLSASRWVFFMLLGLTALVKGIGFGAVLVLATVTVTLAWSRDWVTFRALVFPVGWLLTLLLALAWPFLVWIQYPAVWELWTLHVTDRLAARPTHFAGEPWWEYLLAPLWQTLPWTPLALVGAFRCTRVSSGKPDHLLWTWAIVPAVLVSAASVRNAHYLIYALPPWSVAVALSLARLSERLQRRGWQSVHTRRCTFAAFAGLGVLCGLGFAIVGPIFDRRGSEWAFYEAAADQLAPEEPLVLLYDDWDGPPYPTPFGSMPHDLAVRLFYLNRPAAWCQGIEAIAHFYRGSSPFAVIARERDIPALQRLGEVDTLASGPTVRRDRSYVLYRIRPIKSVRAEPRQESQVPNRALLSADGQARATR